MRDKDQTGRDDRKGIIEAMFNIQSMHIALLMWGCIFSLIATMCMFMSSDFHKEKRKWILHMLLATAILLLGDSVAWAYKGTSGPWAYWIVRISNFIVFLFSDIILALFHGYICCCLFAGSDIEITFRTKHLIKTVYMITFFAMGLVIVTQFTGLYYTFDAHNLYHRSRFYVISLILPMIGMLIDMQLIIKYREQITSRLMASLLSYIFLPFIAAVILVFYYGISLINIAISISMILMFVEAMIEQGRKVAGQERLIAEQERKLTEARIATMISQIKPHFIYNTLGSIEQLCEIDPKMASDMTHNFAKYLRGNFGELGNIKPIRLSQEISHCKYYVSIEQVRFPDMKITFDLNSEDFLIPALSIQPLIENAIKHGLMKRLEGGEILISSYETDQFYCVKVKDNGGGFDTTLLKEDKEHIGLQNIKGRLRAMCEGSMAIESTQGVGTNVLIQIPKKRGRR